MTNRDGGQFTKRVEFKAIDEERQIATGVVFVPDKVDLHGDFARRELIEEWSIDYMRRLQSLDEPAEGGVMHTAFPDDHVSLVENTILDEDRTIGGTDVPAGSWVQSWQYHDGELWSLIEDGVFEGYSIGGQEMSWSDPMDLDDLPDDVAIAADYDGEQAWEILDGMIWEVSSVDIPAVPDAEILTTKGLEKALPQGKEEFMAEMAERGHSEDEAERLYRYLQRVTGGTMSASSGPGWLSRAKAFFTHGAGASKSADNFEATVFRVVAPDDEADRYDDSVLGIGIDFPNSDVYVDWRNEVFPNELDDAHVSVYGSINDLEQATGNTIESIDTLNAAAAKSLLKDPAAKAAGAAVTKESRTLSAANRRRLMAAHDEIEDTLGSELDFEQNRFSDNDNFGFSLDGKSASTEPAPSDGETSDNTQNMTDDPDNDPFKEAPEWAKALHEGQQSNSAEIKELKEADASDDDDDDDDDKDAFDDAPEWAKALQEEQEKNADAIEEIGKQTGTSQQLGNVEGGEESKSEEPGLNSPDMAGKLFNVPVAED